MTIPKTETPDEKTARNIRVQARYDELMREGRHGHYETMFRVVREEVDRTAATRDDAVREALISAGCTSRDGTVVHDSMDRVLAALQGVKP